MGETVPPAPASPTASRFSAWQPQDIIALIILGIAAGTIAGVFFKNDNPTIQLVVGVVIGGLARDVSAFFFGSSKGSQNKDVVIAQQQEQNKGAP